MNVTAPNKTVSAPYNFVPLSDRVCLAADLGLTETPSQDRPESEASSGIIDVTLTCDTPLLVSWSENAAERRVKRFGRTEHGELAIPGSTLRGMIRNVVEIASFGKMSLVSDLRTTVRDLSPAARIDYGSRVSAQLKDDSGQNAAFTPLSQAGWLRLDGDKIKIRPCAFARIDHTDIDRLVPDFRAKVVADLKAKPITNDMSVAWRVEQHFTEGGGVIEQSLWVQDREKSANVHFHSPTAKGDEKPLRYRRAALNRTDAVRLTPREEALAALGQRFNKGTATAHAGKLVFTGMPSDKKHMEFFFFGESDQEEVIPREAWERFLDAHENHEPPSPEWCERRRAEFWAGTPIPVFFMTDSLGKIAHLGLAMMFKLAADKRVTDLIDPAKRSHLNAKATDLAERIFGKLETDKAKGDGWRGRVSIGWARKDGDWTEEAQKVPAIMAKPKPGFAASYVRQTEVKEDYTLFNQSQYRSYMDYRGAKEKVRGWKRYPVGGWPDRGPQPPQQGAGDSVSELYPLTPGNGQVLRFRFRLRYHNLAPVELGALVWAVTWGGDDRLRHALGMGRPFGWGQVRLQADLTSEQTEARDAFVAKMEAWALSAKIAGGWRQSVQLRKLCAMADPAIANGTAGKAVLQQMRIQINVPNGNDFVKAKSEKAVLPEYPETGEEAAPPIMVIEGGAAVRKDTEVSKPRYPTPLSFTKQGEANYQTMNPAGSRTGLTCSAELVGQTVAKTNGVPVTVTSYEEPDTFWVTPLSTPNARPERVQFRQLKPRKSP